MKIQMLLVAAAVTLNVRAVEIGGVRPELSYDNEDGECGTGAVVPWARSLWVVTYPPHRPAGSEDKLWRITEDYRLEARPESIGGTHANRMIHRESNQLLIGPYLIDAQGRVRAVPTHRMPGRLTGTARCLVDPANKVYVTDMEEALYELDVRDLSTRTLIRDGHNKEHFDRLFAERKVAPPPGWAEAEDSALFGYHGKGTCSGFGKVFYANNGWYNERAMKDPTTPSGALAEWRPGDRQWTLIRTNQFTEVTTRDGIWGNEHPDSNPIWALGWDAKSVILTVTTNGTDWTDYRLPKGSHSYDGAHGWNTEWPRIREIGDRETLLATMHGTFWRFPSDFRPGRARGIRPRSNYLKVIGDFCAWQGKVVLGCDDSAMNEFLNKRSVKGAIKGPAKSHSNIRMIDEHELDRMGPPIGNAVVWRNEAVRAGETSDPYLIAGYGLRWLWVSDGEYGLEVDADGSGKWMTAGTVRAGGTDLSQLKGEWVRFVAHRASPKAMVALCLRTEDGRTAESRAPYRAIPLADKAAALLHVNAIDPSALSVSADGRRGYKLDKDLRLSDCPAAVAAVEKSAPLAETAALQEDAASLVYTDDAGGRWRLPRMREGFPMSTGRICREVCTERDHFNAGGLYYELPAENAHGFAGIRPVCAHGLEIRDYCSWRGLFVLSLPGELRAMAIDDFWKAGKPVGVGGPWKRTAVQGGEWSDRYLMNGFDRKALTLSADRDVTVTLAVDADGWDSWIPYATYRVSVGKPLRVDFPRAFGGYWVRLKSDREATVTAQFAYE